MMACLDTNFLIDQSRCNSEFGRRAAKKLTELVSRGEIIATTRFSVAELYVGVQLAGDPGRELESVRRIISNLEILPFNNRSAWLFGEFTARLRRIGRPAGDMDIMIAASTVAFNHILVTRNTSHFSGIPELTVEDY
jgi:tRNA(fMet)-specific endonuclease VapC